MNSQALHLTTVLLWLQWEPHTARFSYEWTLSCPKFLSRGNVTMMRFLAQQHWGLSFDENLTHFHRQPSLAPHSLGRSRDFTKPGCTRATRWTESPWIHTPGSFHLCHPSPAQGFLSESGRNVEMSSFSSQLHLQELSQCYSLLRMEKILSCQAARWWKISRGTEREQVTDTSMDLPLNSSAGVISKSCLNIKTNENIFLPETLFTED